MKVNEFISTLRDDLKCRDESLIFRWLEFNGILAEEGESKLETALEDTAKALYYVKNNFNEETLQETLTYPTLANEIINSAVLFHAGASIELVDSYTKNGIIECGYIPSTYDERGMLSIVYCVGSDDRVFICHGISIDVLKSMVERAMHEAQKNGSTVGMELENFAQNDNRIRDYGQGVIGIFMLNIYRLDKDCSAFGCRVTCLSNFEVITEDKHPALTAVKCETIENEIKNDVNADLCDEFQGLSM